MKTSILILIPFFLVKIALSQEYSFPLYFEDVAGNKDTLQFGFDEFASSDIDESLGEVNIKNRPYDSTLFAFFTDAVIREDRNCELASEKQPSYVSKKQYVNIRNTFFIEIGFVVQNWPLKISWDQNEISSFDLNEYSGYSNQHIIITGFHPPNGWFDGVCCGSGWPDIYVVI